MTSIQYCIYRNKSNLGICKCKKSLNGNKLCIKHIDADSNLIKLYESIYDVIKYKKNLELHDYYLIFKNIELKFFIIMLEQLSKNNLLKIFDKYLLDKNKKKSVLIKKIIVIFHKSLDIDNNNIDSVIYIQKMFRIKKNLEFTNNEDPFTYTPLIELPSNNIICYKEDNKKYGFDAVELLYYIEKNIKDGLESYNPYTRKLFDNNIIECLKNFIAKNKLIKKDVNICIWNSDLHAYTELSFVIEKAGFYNSPSWFLKLKNSEIITIIKLYLYLTNDIKYYTFKNKGNNSLVFYFCKEAIKLFNNYNDNYILCCNFIKALSMISNDFYNNLPEWIIDIETSQRNILEINNFLLFYYISIND